MHTSDIGCVLSCGSGIKVVSLCLILLVLLELRATHVNTTQEHANLQKRRRKISSNFAKRRWGEKAFGKSSLLSDSAEDLCCGTRRTSPENLPLPCYEYLT